MLATVETAWLFTRGSESVRIVRVARRHGIMTLLVQGPGDTTDQIEFSDVLSCMTYQADLERRLVANGFTLERFNSDRRAADAVNRKGRGERRRLPQLFL